jgi:hypothetical protein
MSPETGSPATDDVVARLREGASAVPHARFDSVAVLASAREALRRRRRRQSVTGAVAGGLLALTVASPVHLPGVGTVTMPGGHELRGVLGVQDPDAPAPEPGIDLGELLWHFNLGPPPSATTMAAEVAGLQRHAVPVLEELRPTWYEKSACDVLEYPRGTFSDDGTCGGRPGERPFDDAARADLDRIVDAVERSGVPSDELLRASYSADGSLITAAFARAGGGIQWNYAYVYSPAARPPEHRTALGPITVTPIGTTGWWFEQAPND